MGFTGFRVINVCGLFCVFYGVCYTDAVTVAFGFCVGVSDIGALDYSFGGKMVHTEIW